MNRILALLMVVFLISCDKEETQLLPNANPIDHYSLEISVLDCLLELCSNPIVVSGMDVKIYTELEDAINDTNSAVVRPTNQDGIIFLNIQNANAVFLRIDHPTDGVYISNKITLSKNIITHHQIVFRGNLVYNNESVLSKRQEHISFEYPTVGQVSRYKYFNNPDIVNHSVDQQYEDLTLTVTIKEQIDEFTFIVEERVDNAPYGFEFITSQTVSNKWDFGDHALVIYRQESESNNLILSYLFNCRIYSTNTNENYCLLHCPALNNDIDFEENYTTYSSWQCATIQAFELNNNQYTDAMSVYDVNHGTNPNYKVKAYNFQDGVIRSINLKRNPANTYGFDLILD